MWWDIDTLIKNENLENVPILLAHAWSGCDTTSALYKRGKINVLKHLKSPEFRESVRTFGDIRSSAKDIKEAGIKMALKIYGGKGTDTLTSLRYAKFKQMVLENAKFQPESLPPTEGAMLYHSFRVHLQQCIWKQLDLKCLNPLECGWRVSNGNLVPIKTD